MAMAFARAEKEPTYPMAIWLQFNERDGNITFLSALRVNRRGPHGGILGIHV